MESYYKSNKATIFQVDNLKLLNTLPDNSIDLIYCDILYNTGRKFKDYNDNLGTPQEAIDWYRPRLLEMKRVLKESGSILIQCDYRLSPHIQIEINKYLVFQDKIIWKKQKQVRVLSQKKHYQKIMMKFYIIQNQIILM